jgi:hypothetical protein
VSEGDSGSVESDRLTERMIRFVFGVEQHLRGVKSSFSKTKRQCRNKMNKM